MGEAYPFFMFTNCKAEEAVNYYKNIFNDVLVENIIRWEDGNPMGPAGKIMNLHFTIKGTVFRFMDSTGHDHSLTP